MRLFDHLSNKTKKANILDLVVSRYDLSLWRGESREKSFPWVFSLVLRRTVFQIFVYILQPPLEPARDPSDDMLESRMCNTVVTGSDRGGLYDMIRACWFAISPEIPLDPIKVNMLIQKIAQTDRSIVRPEIIRIGQTIKFFAVYQRC